MGGVLTTIERPATVLPHSEGPAAASEAEIQATKEDNSVATVADPDPAQGSPPSENPNAVVVEGDVLLDGLVPRDDADVQSATTPPKADAPSDLPEITYEVPPYLRHQLEDQAASIPCFAPVAQTSSMAEVISKFITEPTKSIRQQFRPPQLQSDRR